VDGNRLQPGILQLSETKNSQNRRGGIKSEAFQLNPGLHKSNKSSDFKPLNLSWYLSISI